MKPAEQAARQRLGTAKQRLMRAVCKGCHDGWPVDRGRHIAPTYDRDPSVTYYERCLAREALNGR